MNRIPFFLITGFLGSGKTTFLDRIINEFSKDKKIAIIQNEFAPANVDGKELKRKSNSHFELLEINNGSVFCVCLLQNFVQSLEKFLETAKPDILFLETSGLSDPVSIGEMLTAEKIQEKIFLSGSICIVDSLNFSKSGKFTLQTTHQISLADSIIVNKVDLLPLSNELNEVLKSINPYAAILSATYCNVPIKNLIEDLKKSKSSSSYPLFEDVSSVRPEIIVSVLRTTRPIAKDKYTAFLSELAKKCIRAKGYIVIDDSSNRAVQISFDQIQTETYSSTKLQTEMIVMSESFTLRDLNILYKAYT